MYDIKKTSLDLANRAFNYVLDTLTVKNSSRVDNLGHHGANYGKDLQGPAPVSYIHRSPSSVRQIHMGRQHNNNGPKGNYSAPKQGNQKARRMLRR